jgi:hypothetical protein
MSQENEVLFREVQNFRGKFRLMHLFLALAVAGACFAITVAILKNPDKSLGSILGTAGGLIITIGIAALFVVLKLETEVRSDGLYVRYFPFHFKYKKINPDDLTEYCARQYSPLREYGGWGIKCGKGGKAYNVKGNRGLQLVFTNGKRLLIGSQKPDELEQAMRLVSGA